MNIDKAINSKEISYWLVRDNKINVVKKGGNYVGYIHFRGGRPEFVEDQEKFVL